MLVEVERALTVEKRRRNIKQSDDLPIRWPNKAVLHNFLLMRLVLRLILRVRQFPLLAFVDRNRPAPGSGVTWWSYTMKTVMLSKPAQVPW